jgi:hypothetical protein
VKYLFIELTTENDILWRGREGFLPPIGS